MEKIAAGTKNTDGTSLNDAEATSENKIPRPAQINLSSAIFKIDLLDKIQSSPELDEPLFPIIALQKKLFILFYLRQRWN